MTDFADPSLRPLADVGVSSVTLKGKATKPASDPENEPEPLLEDPEVEDRLRKAGFRKTGGAWSRNRR